MRRRDFICVIGAAAVWPWTAHAEQPAMPVIGFLNAESAQGYARPLAAFLKGLKESGKNIGSHVEIRIRDNGSGIPADVKEKMFDPFFTTKPAGEGTGLGLAISHDIIVKQHDGSIEVDTQPGEFAEIRVILPRTPTR
jgi:signal transduction histidine kinase